MVIRRYHAILIGSALLLSGAVSHSSREPLPLRLARPEIRTLPPRPWIALTFDDGPHPVMTQRLINELRAEGIPATFFIVGKMAVRYPHIVQDMTRLGHEVANHTFSHPKLTKVDTRDILNELAQTRSVIYRLTGQDTLLYRPPGGIYSKRTVRAASKAGYQMVLWDVLTKDVNGASIPVMKERIFNQVKDGSIILMHSGVPNTVQMLPEVILELRGRGYHFVTVSQMLGFDPTQGDRLPPLPAEPISPLAFR